ncbi:cytochrome P450 [Actinocorallia sp. API 0066]|uniref:cytochrome P450 n=1 Tax=Actinocorallia sp. API 0066 TaxID=2896846 RepID=UPI001E3301F7|nr:cytochrome P450 [Actinocorallia sp. API 0066]MCD0449683.1 cytochrome P450 [Actinocorallia sp. API 0066]
MVKAEAPACPYDGSPRYPFDKGESTAELNPIYFELGPGVWPIWMDLADRPAFLVNGHALLKHVFETPDLFHQPVQPIPGVVPLQGSLLAMQGEDHLRVRRPATRQFTRGAVNTRRERLAGQVAAKLDGLAGQERVDLVADFAIPLTLEVLGETLGVPEEALPLFIGWGDRFLNFADPADARAAVMEMCGYIGGQLVEREQNGTRGDMLSAYIEGRGKEVTRQEAVMVGANVIAGGWETTTTMITAMVYYLLTHPEQWRRLIDEPALIPGAVQELLRTRPASGDDGPPRIAARDTELGGVQIPAGSILILGKYGASADPDVFPAPRDVDFERANADDHFAFGAGPHICLGKWLAVAVLEEVLAALTTRHPDLRLTGDPLQWRKRSGARRPERLWVHLS